MLSRTWKRKVWRTTTSDAVDWFILSMSQRHDNDRWVSSTLLHNSYVLVVSCRLRPHVAEVASTHASDIDDVPGQLHVPPQSVLAPQPGTVWNEDFLGRFAALRRGGSGSSGTTDSDRHPANDLAPTSGVPCACAEMTGAYPALSLRRTSKSRPHPVQRTRVT